MREKHQDEFIDVLFALEERIMRKLQTSSLAIVTNLNSSAKICTVKPFPVDDVSQVCEIYCKYPPHLEKYLLKNTIVILLYIDKDFRQNLAQIEKSGGINIMKTSSEVQHSDSYGMIIQIYKSDYVEEEA